MSLLQRPTLLVVNYSIVNQSCYTRVIMHVIDFGGNFKLAQCSLGTFG